MSTDLSGLLSCTYGTSAFQVETFGVKETPVVKEGIGRTATDVQVTIEGYFDGTDAANMAAQTAALMDDLRTDGRDLVLLGINGQVGYALPAAVCQNGGPHVEFDLQPSSSPLRLAAKLVVKTSKIPDPTKPPLDSWKLQVKTRPDGLREVTRSGEVNGANTPAFFTGQVVPAFKVLFDYPLWVIEQQYEQSGDVTKSKLTYAFTATEMRAPLPGAGGDHAVQGEVTVKRDRDEQFRLTTVHQFDLLCVGDPEAVLHQVRPAADVILKESVEITKVRESRLRATFTILTSGSGSPLMNWGQTLEIDRASRAYEVKEYPGSDPIVIQKPRTVERLVQSGSATGERAYCVPPPPIAPLLEQPQITFEDLGDDVQCRTTWRYSMFYAERGNRPAAKPFPTTTTSLEFLSRERADIAFVKRVNLQAKATAL